MDVKIGLGELLFPSLTAHVVGEAGRQGPRLGACVGTTAARGVGRRGGCRHSTSSRTELLTKYKITH